MPNPSLTHQRLAAAPDRTARWTLLLVADDGRLRQVPRLKALLTAGLVALCVALACALVFFVRYNSARIHAAQMAQRLEETRQALAAAREQHQLLLAQAVIAGQPPEGRDRAAGPSAADAVPSAANPPAAADTNFVEAQELSFSHNKGSRHFQVQFKLKNNAGEQVAGYAFVVLYPQDRHAGNGPLVIPDADLEGDRPGPYKKGRPFTISRYTTVRLDGRDNDPGRFATAGVVVYDKDGSLVIEQRFDLNAPDVMRPGEER